MGHCLGDADITYTREGGGGEGGRREGEREGEGGREGELALLSCSVRRLVQTTHRAVLGCTYTHEQPLGILPPPIPAQTDREALEMSTCVTV